MSQGGAIGQTMGNMSAMRNGAAPTAQNAAGNVYTTPITSSGNNPTSPAQNPNNGPLTNTAPGMMGGMGGPANDMQPFSQQSIPPQLQQFAQQYGGKGGMPGQQRQQTNPLQAQQQFSQQQAMSQGLGSLMTTQQMPQSSTNSLQ